MSSVSTQPYAPPMQSFAFLSSGISSILPSYTSLRLVVLTSVLSSLSLGVTYYCSVRFPSYVLSVGVILHAPVSGVLTLLTLLFAFPTAKVRQAVLLKIPQWRYCYLRHKKEQQPSALYAKVGIPLFFLEIICCALPLLSSGCSVKIKV